MNIVARAANMVVAPRREWQRIAAEQFGVVRLYVAYVAVLAAIPVAAQSLRMWFDAVRLSDVVDVAVSGYVMAFVFVTALGLVASWLAPLFGGAADVIQGVRLAGFGLSPAWLGGIFLLLPVVGGLLAPVAVVYSFYVFYLGTADLVGVAGGRRIGFTIAAIAAAIIAAAILQVPFDFLEGHFGLITPQPPVANPG